MYILRFSGFIPEYKRKEFEQSIRRISGGLDLFEMHLSMAHNLLIEDHYSVEIRFQNIEMVRQFVRSEQYRLIEGCFKTLGYLKEYAVFESQALKQEDL